ncbi:hypothetical protein DPMN_079316 [Dreissena polymorpha]|uniref:Uncharacterized protein n=1 Tax=Dreissena polymorpha TaxID=45954 RepID=A0A9D3YSC9_DREPO|nr:hypothetical protein DPMN_079316 [Dreissena polymorpha]
MAPSEGPWRVQFSIDLPVGLSRLVIHCSLSRIRRRIPTWQGKMLRYRIGGKTCGGPVSSVGREPVL